MTPHSQPVGAPERVFIQPSMAVTGTDGNPLYATAWFDDPRNVHDNGKPVHEYIRAAPMPQGVAEAIERVRQYSFTASRLECEAADKAARLLASALESSLQRLALMESQLPQWEKIETAPKDEIPIVAYREGDGCAVVVWEFSHWVMHFDGTTITGDWGPTHWVPLPDYAPLPIEGQVR